MTKRALLVGINEFKERLEGDVEKKRRKWQLEGCTNDVASFKDLLVEYYDFKDPDKNPDDDDPDIKVLENEKAERRDILKGLDWLLGDCKVGDVRLFQISSHGTFVADQSGDEEDGKDEVLVAHVHDWKKPFRDDELRKKFDKIPPGVNFTFIADCCHGGTIEGMIEGPWPETLGERKIKPPIEIYHEVYDAAGEFQNRAPDLGKPAGNGNGAKKKLYGLRPTERHFLLAACRSDQTAAEATLEGKPRGAFTWTLEKAISRKKGKLKYQELIDRSGYLLKPYAQEPQLECPDEWRRMQFLEPLGPSHEKVKNHGKEKKMASNLVEFLAKMGGYKKLMGRGKMEKSLKKLSKEEREILKSGDADAIEAWVAKRDTYKPIGQQGGG